MWLYFCREAPFTSQWVYKQLVSCAHFSLHVDEELYNHSLHRIKSSSVSEPAPVMAQGLDGNQPNFRLATDFTTFTLSQIISFSRSWKQTIASHPVSQNSCLTECLCFCSSSPTWCPGLLRTSVLSAPARRASATRARSSTASSLSSCARW